MHLVKKLSIAVFLIVSLTINTYASSSIYDFKNTKSEGFIEVVKQWVSGITDSVPNIGISTKKPNKNPLGVTIRFDSNGGSFSDGSLSRSIVYSRSGRVVSGSWLGNPEFYSNEAVTFDGWYTGSVGGDKVDLSEDGSISTPVSYDTTLYARWYYPTRIAVSIYGIEHDIDENGDTMGLTFGGATGDYRNSYKSHQPDGESENGNPHRCIHYDTWEKIIEYQKKDPYIYEQCLAEGCTKSVGLTDGGITILGRRYNCGKGDGVSVLSGFTELNGKKVLWGQTAKAYNEEGIGGYGASNIRAVLNGWDELYDSSLNPDTYDLSSENCLLYSFPDVLKEAIGRKKIPYIMKDGKAEGIDFISSENVGYVYDKLWIFDVYEIINRDYYRDLYKSIGISGIYEKVLLEGSLKKLWRYSNLASYPVRSVYPYKNDRIYLISCLDGYVNSSTGYIINYSYSDGVNVGFSLSR